PSLASSPAKKFICKTCDRIDQARRLPSCKSNISSSPTQSACRYIPERIYSKIADSKESDPQECESADSGTMNEFVP
ncbi:hypothetical protein AVEN_212060-1, partial [Araneus ventricosus]